MLIAIPLTLLAMPVSRIVFSRSWFCSPNWMSSLTPCCWAASLAPFTTASKKAFDDWSHGMKRILIFDHSALWSASAAPAAATPNSDRAAPIADAAISLVTEFMRFLTICGLGFLGGSAAAAPTGQMGWIGGSLNLRQTQAPSPAPAPPGSSEWRKLLDEP